jgi:hypothetical protein
MTKPAFFLIACTAAVWTVILQFQLSKLVSSAPAVQLVPDPPSIRQTSATQPAPPIDGPQKEERCAINLFGLPRAFDSLVLPSLVQNVIKINARYNCDYFVHYYNLTEEQAGRSGKGGVLNPSEILSLTGEVHRYAPQHADRRPRVVFQVDQEAAFWNNYNDLIHRTRTATDSLGRLLFYPWRLSTYTYPTTVDNILKQWHSIHAVFDVMDGDAVANNVNYTRVAMLRSDVVYVTPIDIYRLDERPGDLSYDYGNRHAVVAAFGRHPVSDRIIYGPYRAVEMWATQRFSRLEAHAQKILRTDPGYGIHPERFMNITMFPAIREAGIPIHEHAQMCFLRARADESIWVSDCDGELPITVPTIPERVGNDTKGLVEALIGRQCGMITYIRSNVRSLDCKSKQ